MVPTFFDIALTSAFTSAVERASSFASVARFMPFSFFTSTSVAITCAPSRTNASAIARPIPCPAAVTSATLPFSRSAIVVLSASRSIQFGESPFMSALAIEILPREPALEAALARGPLAVEHDVPGGVAAASLDDHVLAKNALEGEAEAQRRAPRRGIERVAFPLVAPVAKHLEHVTREQILGFGGERRALQGGTQDDVADLEIGRA